MKRKSIISNMRKSLKSKATNAAKQTLYMGMWGEEVPKGKKKVKCY